MLFHPCQKKSTDKRLADIVFLLYQKGIKMLICYLRSFPPVMNRYNWTHFWIITALFCICKAGLAKYFINNRSVCGANSHYNRVIKSIQVQTKFQPTNMRQQKLHKEEPMLKTLKASIFALSTNFTSHGYFVFSFTYEFCMC